MTRVVSITAPALEENGRSFKLAQSIARLGYESIVVEGAPSTSLDDLPFELISPPAGGVVNGRRAGAPEPPGGSILNRSKQMIRFRNASYIFRFNAHVYRSQNRETEALLPDADVYLLQNIWQYRAVRRKLRRTGARLIYDAPDANWEPGQNETYESGAMRAVHRGWEAIERGCIRRAERYFTVSEGVADLLESRFKRRPEVIRNTHDLRMDRPPAADIRKVTGVGPDDFLLVMSGNWKPGHALSEALEAMSELPDRIHLAFIGLDFEQGARGLVQGARLGDRIHLLDPVPTSEVVGFISTADASPILYRAESMNYDYALPNGFFHAVAAGLPVLYPSLTEMRTLGSQYDLGIEFDPHDPASIAAAVRALGEDPIAAKRYRANVEKAREVLNWEHEEALLREMLRPGPSRPAPEASSTSPTGAGSPPRG